MTTYTYALKDGTQISIPAQYRYPHCGEVAEQGITETTLRFITESGTFERPVNTVVENGNLELSHWDEVVCEEIIACDDLVRIELLDETGAVVSPVYISSETGM